MEQTTAIPLSKRKLWLLLGLSIAFVTMGYWLLGRAPEYEGYQQWKLLFGAWSCMVFFGLCAPIFIVKLVDKRPGLVINAIGIYRLGVFAYHEPILWKHITHCATQQVKRTKLLLIHVDNVEEEIAKLPPVTRWFQRLIVSSTGTPFSLSSAALKGKFTDLQALIEGGIARHRHGTPT